MAIPDLLWACPVCGRDKGLRTGELPDACGGCGTRFDRVRGARIRARLRGGEAHTRTAAEWVDALPDPGTLLRPAGTVRQARVRARFVERYETVRAGSRYVNRIEIFGPREQGTLTLDPDRLTYDRGDAADGAGKALAWPLLELAAVQASSRTLQVRGRPHPLASFAFPDDSGFLWEQLLALTVRDAYRRAGMGEVVELQPRIVTR